MRDYYILAGLMAMVLIGPAVVLELLDERDERRKRQQAARDSGPRGA